MEKCDLVEKTILCTPQPTACSTVDRRNLRKKQLNNELAECDSDTSSLGILSLNNIDISGKNINVNENRLSDANILLDKQRLLANSSLERAKLAGLPSQYLKPNGTREDSSYMSNGSTLNESDLLMSTPRNNSTPRESLLDDKNVSRKSRMSIGQSMAQLSEKITKSNIPFDTFFKEFSQTINTETGSFVAEEDAQAKLMADELSWRKKNDMPVESATFTPLKFESFPSNNDMSVGEFFRQKCESISQFAVSPQKTHQPVALVDSIQINDLQLEPSKNKSLSISTIAKILESDVTPKRAENVLMNHVIKKEPSIGEQISLPVSKNSSYTSNYSENEALQCIVNKENLDTNNLKREFLSTSPQPLSSASSVISSRPSSTLSSLPNGKLPIESTKQELVWGCVKTDRCVTQEFILRNKSSKNLRIQLSIPGHSFRIRKDNRPDSDSLSSTKIVLCGHESRPIIVSFLPTKIGAAIDEIIFTPLDSNLEQTKKQSIRLYGYGGFGNVEIINITKDTQNKFWLSLGDLNTCNVLRQTFIVKNTGTLPSFAFLSITSRDLCAFSNITLSNKFFVLIPQEQKEITVTYTPNSDDYKKFQNSPSVVEIGVIKLVWGTEVNRGRLRRMCRKAAEKNMEVNILSSSLKQKIPGEAMPADIISFKESLNCMTDILKLFTTNEIVLTLEQDPDQTLIPQYPDDSALYHTLSQDNTRFLEETICRDTCEVEPTNIILTPPYKTDDTLFLRSKCNRNLKYHVKSEPEGLHIHPTSGILGKGETIMLNIKCSKTINKKQVFKVLVEVESEVFEATVKTIFIQKS